jgi:phospholipid-transporting ATPase
LQTIKDISTTNGLPDMLPPLFVIVVISMLKDMVEDIKRAKSDRDENTRQCLSLNTNIMKFQKVEWQDLRVGDIVKVHFA